MKYLNLDKNFTPFGEGIACELFDFPSGCEPHIKIQGSDVSVVCITARITSMNDLMLLFLATDAVRRKGALEVSCFISYLPFARQDRVMVTGEPLSIKVISDLINSQGYKNVYLYDVHSDVSSALINNSVVINNFDFVSSVLAGKEDFFIVSPDAGAYKKIFSLCQHLEYKNDIVMCNKIRDVSNGTIRSLTVSHKDLQGKDCYIVDDICDGGGTFTLLSDVLKERNAGRVFLVVSHGIFSKGVDALSNIDHVYTTNSFKDIESSDKVTQYKFNFK